MLARMIGKSAIPINFSYLGGRNYITVTQITQSYLDAMAKLGPIDLILDLSLKIKLPIRRQCFLETNSDVMAKQENSRIVAEFTYVSNGQKYRDVLVEGEILIEGHIPEAPYELIDHVLFNGSEGRVVSPFENSFFCYTYMVIGKALILKHTDSVAPRVVGFFIKRIPSAKEAPFLAVALARPIHQNFCRLNLFVHSEHIGYTTVRL
jgi:hypothetical protein